MNKFLSGIRDIDLLILSNLDDQDLFKLTKAAKYNKYGHILINNDTFWRNKFAKLFPSIVPETLYRKRSWKKFYLIVRKTNVGNVDSNTAMVSRRGFKNMDIITFYIKIGANNWNWFLASSARYNHQDLVEFFISKGANDFVRAHQCSRYSGNNYLIEFLAKKLL